MLFWCTHQAVSQPWQMHSPEPLREEEETWRKQRKTFFIIALTVFFKSKTPSIVFQKQNVLPSGAWLRWSTYIKGSCFLSYRVLGFIVCTYYALDQPLHSTCLCNISQTHTHTKKYFLIVFHIFRKKRPIRPRNSHSFFYRKLSTLESASWLQRKKEGRTFKEAT